MHHLIVELSVGSLERIKTSLEARIIAGTASRYDVDTYVLMQLELAAREFGRGEAQPPSAAVEQGAELHAEPRAEPQPDPRD